MDITHIRADYPLLGVKVNGKPLVYFDNGATSQKPKQVLDSIQHYYETYNANIHRGVHALSQQATDAFERARATVQVHLNAAASKEIIFTSGTTHAINIVANGLVAQWQAGDRVLITAMEHHSNIVPWQMACDRAGVHLDVLPMLPNGTLDLDQLPHLLSANTKIVACTHISNALGTINPIQEIIRQAKSVGALTLIDGAQAVPHLKPDVQELDCDFYVFSGHKMGAPTGIGILYGKEAELEKLTPFQGGGEMIATVTFKKTTYACLPHRLEAGTPNIEGAIALGTAIEYLNTLGWDAIQQREDDLLHYATQKLSLFPTCKIYGSADQKSGVLSFLPAGIHPYDLGVLLDKMGIAVRTGHHCAQPVMDYFNIPGTVRMSLAFYNTTEEIDYFMTCLDKAITMLS
ncbi:MAG: cysteine desulfurase CsdA [Flavobacterium sp. BFFFF2]|nr:MAG: cysteine desulfurase CsdA [Flavobacterium sp. BFFFF2]